MTLLKTVLAMILALGAFGFAGLQELQTYDPIPHCLPCPDGK